MSETDPILPQRSQRSQPPPITTSLASSFPSDIIPKDTEVRVQTILCILFTIAEGATITLATSVVPTLTEDDFVSSATSTTANLQKLAEVWKGSLAALIFVGYAVGTCISGCLSDHSGRRPTILVSYGCMVLVGIFAATVPMTIPTLSVLRFLTGLVCGLGAPASMVLLSEAMPAPQRSKMMCLQGICYVFGEMFCCIGLMFFMPSLQPSVWWVAMSFWITAPPAVLLLFSCPCLQESQRWLICEEDRKTESQWMQSKEFWMTALPLSLALLAGNMSTLGLSYVWPELFRGVTAGGNLMPAARLLIMKAMGIPAMLLGYIILSWNAIGHRQSLLLASFPMAIFTVMALTGSTETLRCLIFGMISTSASTVYFTILCIFTTEAFPTEIRAGAVGVCFAVGRIGAITSPPMYDFFGKKYFSALLAVAVLSSGMAVQAVPHETKGVDLRDWLEDTKASA
eukprot:gnl/MRDRNA2_/MRDRNA2_106570_c0_seq1.p1 gnl/MRDRNA2_/MRDRNA2_106570_c0~~gnl/MRDRNA2_/MRDRNA2_106570_c0_seq1.p1  ORF type:complete len:456 (-),score=57.48 gnl/MRDRNA2_/MRDRNA2_106570_c0_seq1:56-1423(-)